ncbi:MAG: hypothetical protein HYY40_02370 [Bacteroidetes bacterium]|nr:hypothetical protein [Bacteroidota bacterium]
MKILFFFSFLFILSNTLAQTRKEIISTIRNYSDETVFKATYGTDNQVLIAILNDFFQKIDYQVESFSDSQITFTGKIPVTIVKRNYEYYRGTRNIGAIAERSNISNKHCDVYREGHCSPPRAVFRTLYVNDNVIVFIYSEKGQHKIRVKSWFDPYSPVFTKSRFNEWELRKYLYIKYYGDSISCPEEITALINEWNLKYVSDRRKIIQGRDY